jgi:hypothetical protein
MFFTGKIIPRMEINRPDAPRAASVTQRVHFFMHNPDFHVCYAYPYAYVFRRRPQICSFYVLFINNVVPSSCELYVAH